MTVHSKTYYSFLEQFNAFEDNHLMPISKLVVDFCKLPTNETLTKLGEAFKEAFKSLEFTCKNASGYINSKYSDITQEEMKMLSEYFEELRGNLQFEVDTVQDVISDEAFNAISHVKALSEESDDE